MSRRNPARRKLSVIAPVVFYPVFMPLALTATDSFPGGAAVVFRYLYWSTAREAQPSAEEVSDILDASRRNNAAHDITGLLLLHEGSYFQVLEGEETVVRACFARIGRDPRHRGLVTLRAADEPERAFPHWRMGFARLDSLPGTSRDSALDLAKLARLGEVSGEPRIDRLIQTFLSGFRSLGYEAERELRAEGLTGHPRTRRDASAP